MNNREAAICFFFKSRSQDFQQFVSNIFICESMHFIYYCINVLWINKERECWGTCEIYINNCIIYTICLKFSNFEVHSTCVLLAKAIIWNVSISDSYSTSSFISFYNVCKLNLLVQLLYYPWSISCIHNMNWLLVLNMRAIIKEISIVSTFGFDC